MAAPSAPFPSAIEAKILRLLVHHGESYGLAMVKASDGELKRGTIYVTLGRMEEKGLVESRQEESTPNYIGIPRRLYKATALGSRVHDAIEAGNAVLQIGGLTWAH
jgi:DNA-binding PadR family transcriptional regulator